jgi:hypothetical protein
VGGAPDDPLVLLVPANFYFIVLRIAQHNADRIAVIRIMPAVICRIANTLANLGIAVRTAAPDLRESGLRRKNDGQDHFRSCDLSGPGSANPARGGVGSARAPNMTIAAAAKALPSACFTFGVS